MRSLLNRTALLAFSLPIAAGLARGQSTTTPPPAAPAPVVSTPPAGVEPQDTADAKLAVVLRSYTLLQEENDKLRSTQDKVALEKASLEAQLAVAKDALPIADQANALREQLRQTQDQLAAVVTENSQLKTRLALLAPSQSNLMSAPSHPGATPAPKVEAEPAPAPAPAPAVRTHVIAWGDTLSKISQQYYGTPSRWTEILAANRDVLRDEKSLAVGKTLRIP